MAMPRPSVCIFFLALIAAAFSATAAADEEKQTLLQIKKEWGDPPSLDSWGTGGTSSSHCNGWTGIQCDENGKVVAISLVDQDIEGTVPAAVCGLRNLSTLNLYNNFVGGDFPTALYNCSNLQSLNLSQNLFVGAIPDDVDRLSVHLRSLDLSYNNFSGSVPAALARIAGLRQLRLNSNLFDGSFPAELASLAELENLSLAHNPFTPTLIPPEFGNLKNLKYLWISDASLRGGVPEALSNLKQLEHLDLASNNLTGPFPLWIWGLEKLRIVYLFKNQFSGEIAGPSFRASNLTEIDLSENNLTGTIPEEFGKLLGLEFLFLYKNQFSGEIPSDISKIPTLEDIRLFNNNLGGVLPLELGKNSRLNNLEVFGNKLHGPLPENLCAGGRLYSVVAFDNGLSGRLPESLGSCKTLTNLQIHGNGISGDVPNGFWSLPHLGTVIMDGNALSGELPPVLPRNLSRLEIGGNRFSGRVPSVSPGLLVFKASNNAFSGEIPPDLKEMTQLQVLWLDGNQLSGEIPARVGSLTALTELNLGRNKLTGSIPGEIGSLPVLTSLDLAGNQLSGAIPLELGQLKLNFLNLSSNALSGEVPSALLSQAKDSFLSNSGLCSSNGALGLPTCTGRSPSAGHSGSLPRGLLALFAVLGLLFFAVLLAGGFVVARDLRRRKGWEADGLPPWKLTSFQVLDFTESRIIQGLTPENLIASGGSGQVYRVPVGSRSGAVVAVKKIWSSAKPDSRQEREFQAEVQTLSSIRHFNIIKLLCCVSGGDSKLLVYEYLQNGSLHSWLHGKKDSAADLSTRRRDLDWPRRLSIAVGAARGLHYMHHECSPPVVHRDVKSGNILLDLEFRPKVADFGLARIPAGGRLGPETVTAVAGSFGYMAPECAYSRKVSEKMDVYSFGVVLLELVTGKQAGYGSEEGCLAEWAWRRFQEGRPVMDVVDEEIRDPLYLGELSTVLRLGIICTGTLPSTRPSMKDVLHVLTSCSQTNGLTKKPSIREYDAAPLLLAAERSSRRRKGHSFGGSDDEREEEEERTMACNV